MSAQGAALGNGSEQMQKPQRGGPKPPALIINGYEDHIHALCQLSRKFSIAKVVQEAKTETSKWMKKQPHRAAPLGLAFHLSP